MAGEATRRCEENSKTELKEGIESLGNPIDYERLLVKDNTGTPLISKVEKGLRNLPAENARFVRGNAGFLDRLNDLKGTNKEQKLASILWFGEQGEQEHIAVLEEKEKDEEDAEIKSAYKKAMLRLNERINSNKPIDEDETLLDDSDVFVSPVISSIKVKMKARMRGKVKSL